MTHRQKAQGCAGPDVSSCHAVTTKALYARLLQDFASLSVEASKLQPKGDQKGRELCWICLCQATNTSSRRTMSGMDGLEVAVGPSTPLAIAAHDSFAAVLPSPRAPAPGASPEPDGGSPAMNPKLQAFLEGPTRCDLCSSLFLLGLGVLLPWNCLLLA